MSKLRKIFTGKRPFPQRLLLAVLPTLAFSFTLFFFGPLDLSYVSRSYLNYSPLDILPATALIMAAVFAFLLLAASVPGGILHAFLVSVYTGLSMGMYIQGAFLNPNFGTLDGHSVNWPSFSGMMLINLVIWFAILLIPHLIHYFSNRVWRSFVMLICAAMVLMQAVSLGVKLADQAKTDRGRADSYYLSTEKMFQAGSGKNITVFLLDTTSSSDLLAMLEKYPDALYPFRDFTWYSNANSRYMFTVPSLVSLLTGQEWDCEHVSVQDYMNGAWKSDKAASFYGKLQDRGFIRNFYMLLPEAAKDPGVLNGIFSNLMLTGKDKSIDTQALLKLYKLSFYRYFPLMMKPFFVIYTTDISNVVTTRDAMKGEWDFVSGMNTESLTVGQDQNVFSFFYLQGSHRPYRIDERGRLISSELAPEYLTNYSELEDQIAGFFYLIGDYLRQLKELGLYDETGVIILADHGNNSESSADHQPIYLIKMPGSSYPEMKTVSSPITTQECFLADIMAMIGENSPDWGIPSSRISGEPTERWTRVYAKDSAYPSLDGSAYNVMRIYRYTGDRDELIQQWMSGNYETVPMLDCYY